MSCRDSVRRRKRAQLPCYAFQWPRREDHSSAWTKRTFQIREPERKSHHRTRRQGLISPHDSSCYVLASARVPWRVLRAPAHRQSGKGSPAAGCAASCAAVPGEDKSIHKQQTPIRKPIERTPEGRKGGGGEDGLDLTCHEPHDLMQTHVMTLTRPDRATHLFHHAE